jgi:hypothetical protein
MMLFAELPKFPMKGFHGHRDMALGGLKER